MLSKKAPATHKIHAHHKPNMQHKSLQTNLHSRNATTERKHNQTDEVKPSTPSSNLFGNTKKFMRTHAHAHARARVRTHAHARGITLLLSKKAPATHNSRTSKTKHATQIFANTPALAQCDDCVPHNGSYKYVSTNTLHAKHKWQNTNDLQTASQLACTRATIFVLSTMGTQHLCLSRQKLLGT